MKGTKSTQDLRVCPSQLIAEGRKIRVARCWPNRNYGLNEASRDPAVKYGDVDEFLQLLSPGAFLGGVDFQGSFRHWPVSPACRRFLGVRRPVSGRIYFFS